MAGFAPIFVALALAQADASATAAPIPTPTPTATSTSTPLATPAEPAAPPPAPRVRVDPAVERAEAERAARTFLNALVAADADGLAAAASERSFSFDGDAVSGREPVRARWRAILAARPGPAPKPGALEVLLAQEAVAKHGPPPARVAPLARPGAYVALGDIGGRTVVLFLAREGGRMAVLGMHD